MENHENDFLKDNSKLKIPTVLPLLSLNDFVMFPNVIFPLSISDEKTIKMVNHALEGDKIVGIFTLRRPEDVKKSEAAYYNIGTASSIIKMFRVPDGSIRLLVQGLARIKKKSIIQLEPFEILEVSQIESIKHESQKLEALIRLLSDDFREVIDSAPYLSEDLKAALIKILNRSSKMNQK